MKQVAVVDGERIELQWGYDGAGSVAAEVGGVAYRVVVSCSQAGVYWLNCGNRSIEARVLPERDGYLVFVGSTPVRVDILDSAVARGRLRDHAYRGTGDVRATMPGRVVKVLVSEGSHVNAHQGLIVVEAMKMQNEIKSSKAGTVKNLRVSEEMTVEADELLATVE